MKNKIIVIGSANTDLVIHTAKMPKLGETLEGENFMINPGGKGLNQAVAVAKLGGKASFLGAVGTDANGGILLDALAEYGISFEGARLNGTPTGIAMITVVNGDNFIIVDPGANDKLTPEMIEEKRDAIAGSDYCILQLEIPVETVVRACEIAKECGTAVVLNPAPFKKLPNKIYPLVDYLIPNEHEAKDITGIYPDNEENCVKAVTKLREMGVKNVIITLGDRGSVYNDGDEILFRPAQKVTAVDTTSAGDCFIGALTTALSRGNTLESAIDYATKASAIAVSRRGASRSIPYEHEV
ncbi:MAG: ribokinase [Clostridia bacterium]|nr:ribokinase [Clostridia bacterium]